MATALMPEPILDIDALVEAEIEALNARYRSREFREAVTPRWPPDEYVRRVVDAHQEILERWGGWRWHSGPLEQVDIRPTIVADIFHETARLFEGKGLPLMEWVTAEEAAFCTLGKCHLPMPMCRDAGHFRQKIFVPEDGISEHAVRYAAQHQVQVRRGQAIARAVLRDVRRKFGDHPLYVQMWEHLFEKLGQAWAGGKSLGITFTVAPSDFIQFGHLGESSCYRVGSCHETSKLNLSLLRNSIGIFFYRDEVETEATPNSLRAVPPSGRAWGMVDLETQGAVLTNTYLENWVTTRPSVLRALREAFGFPDLIPDLTNRGTLTRLGVRHSKKVWAFVNADQHIVAPEGMHEETHRNLAGYVDAFILHRSIQHGSASVCSTCGNPGVDGAEIRFCNHDRRCAHAAAENERYEICPHCEQHCASCGAVGCRHCIDGSTRCMNPECRKVVCRACAQGAGEACFRCGEQEIFCMECERDRQALARCQECAHPMCSNCLQRCGQPGCDCGTVCKSCRRVALRNCSRCYVPTCAHQLQEVMGGLEHVCRTCLPDGPAPIEFHLPDGEEPLSQNDIRRYQAELLQIPREFLDEHFGEMYRYQWGHRAIARHE